jgi:valyl-tRNA synthetase
MHPIIPFLTEYSYNIIAKENIFSSKSRFEEDFFIPVIKEESQNFMDCLFLILSSIRNIKTKKKLVKSFFLELVPEWEKKTKCGLNFNYFTRKFLEVEVVEIDKTTKKEDMFFVDLNPFGVI